MYDAQSDRTWPLLEPRKISYAPCVQTWSLPIESRPEWITTSRSDRGESLPSYASSDEQLPPTKHSEKASPTTSSKPGLAREQKYDSLKHLCLEGSEDLERYEPGGFHPVDLSDILDGRFEVVYKLGNGGIGMVWLCYEFRVKKWRAIKINAAHRSSDDSPELKALQVVKENSITLAELNANHVVMPLETFWIEGPNGRHLCSVLPVLGPTVEDWRNGVGPDSARVNSVCRQITEGLGFLHSQGICHADFRPQNILMKLKEEDIFAGRNKDEVLSLLPPSKRAEIITLDGNPTPHAPRWIIEEENWLLYAPKGLTSDNIAIVDFGESFKVSSSSPTPSPKSLGIPLKYAAPEVAFGGPGGIPGGVGCDIWSLAYTLMEVRLGRSILVKTVLGVIWLMERFVGPVPCPYRARAAGMLRCFLGRFGGGGGRMGVEWMEYLDKEEQLALEEDKDDDASSSSSPPLLRLTAPDKSLKELEEEEAENSPYTEPLEIFLGKELTASFYYSEDSTDGGAIGGGGWGGTWKTVNYHLPGDEVVAFADLLTKMLRYEPAERIGASEALKHCWFGGRTSDQEKDGSFMVVDEVL